MIAYNPHLFELLKVCVLQEARIQNIIPSECGKLSELIFLKTKKRVSETTIKRIYGFALSKFNPSTFTLQTLSQYCGYSSWEEFYKHQRSEEQVTKPAISWDNLCHRANNITRFTLKSLKQRSGIPYRFTIKRKTFFSHWEAFLQSNKTATVFISQAAFGKTIGLCHVIDELVKDNTDDTCNVNFILFFSANSITNISPNELNLGDWILAFLGLNARDSLIDIFESNKSRFFYLIIDDFDDYNFKTDQFKVFFNQLIDVISYYSQYSWFKVVLTMRSTTWLNFKQLTQISAEIENNWYLGNLNEQGNVRNIEPLNVDEILHLSQNINPAIETVNHLEESSLKKLSNPLLFQLYYQYKSPKFELNAHDPFCLYQITSKYCSSKIYYGANSVEKVILVKQLLDLLDYKSNMFTVDKIYFYPYAKEYPATYKELVNTNIFLEQNLSKGLQYNESLGFFGQNVLDYCLAKKFYASNGNLLDKNLVNEIENTLGNSIIKPQIVNWLVFFIINADGYEQLSEIRYFNLDAINYIEVITFLCSMLAKRFGEVKDHPKFKHYLNIVGSDDIISLILNVERPNTAYRNVLERLAAFDIAIKLPNI